MGEKRLVKLSSVTRSQRWQVRVEIDEETVRRYVALLESGGEFDADPIVWLDGGWEGGFKTLLDGFHRVAAYERVGRDEIMVEGFEGTREQAEWVALTANTRHGKQFTQKDARRAIERALVLDPSRSNHDLARIFSVSHVTVGNIRKELEIAGRIQRSDVRTTADGRTMNTAQIGANQPTREHWAVRREQEFWIKARRYGLTDEIRAGVLDALQPGSTALSQFEGSFEEALTRLHRFALEHHYRLYPVGGYAAHIATGKVAKVEIATAEYLKVFDERNNDHAAWMVDGIRPSDEKEHAAYLNRGKSSAKPADPVVAASAPASSPRTQLDSTKLFVRVGHVVGYSTYRDGDMLAVVTGEPYMYEGRHLSCVIKYRLPGGSETNGNVPLSQLFDPTNHFVQIPSGQIGIIQSIREDKISVSRPNGEGGYQTNTLNWDHCELVLLKEGQRVKTRAGRIGELIKDQNGALLSVRDLETGIVSEHNWQLVIPMPSPEPVPNEEPVKMLTKDECAGPLKELGSTHLDGLLRIHQRNKEGLLNKPVIEALIEKGLIRLKDNVGSGSRYPLDFELTQVALDAFTKSACVTNTTADFQVGDEVDYFFVHTENHPWTTDHQLGTVVKINKSMIAVQWRVTGNVTNVAPGNLLLINRPQPEAVENEHEDDLSFADDLVDAFMETFTGEDIQEIVPSLAIALCFAEGSGVASPTVIQHIEAVASWFSDIAHTASVELMKQNAPAG